MNFEKARFLDKDLVDLFGKTDLERHTDALPLVEMEIDGRSEGVLNPLVWGYLPFTSYKYLPDD